MTLNVIAGSTIRVVNTFYNFDGNPQDPQLVKFKVYDSSYKIIGDYALTDANKLSEGVYFYDYITPIELPKNMIFEFYGEISGNPTIERQRVTTSFMKG